MAKKTSIKKNKNQLTIFAINASMLLIVVAIAVFSFVFLARALNGVINDSALGEEGLERFNLEKAKELEL